MSKIKFLFQFFLVIFSVFLYSQECGTPNVGSDLRFNVPENADGMTCINVKFHIVRQSNGTGGFDANQIINLTNYLNTFFNNHQININSLGYDYIDNSTYFNLVDSNFNALSNINHNPNAINFYIVNSAPYNGRAGAIISKSLVVKLDRVLTSTSPHEIGHCLNLWHTFQGTAGGSGCAEAINGSNCDSCGDYVCDTPADANTGNTNGYNPDLNNLMSYYLNRIHFTQLQGTRMRNAIIGSTILQQVISNQCNSISGVNQICSTNNYTYSFSNFTNSNVIWTVTPNLQILNSTNTSVTIKAINSTINGNGTITANVNGMIINKIIWIGKPLFSLKLEPDGINFVNVEMVGGNSTNINHQGITSTTWQKISSSGGCNGFFGGNGFFALGHGSCNTWSVYAKITATNSCGTTTIYRTITPPAPYPCGENYKITNSLKNSYQVMRIIDPCAKTIQNIKLENFNDKNSEFQVYDLQGNLIYKEISNQINIDHLKNGIYILKTIVNNEVLTNKIIKQ